MIVIELREAAYEKAFELMDEAKDTSKKQKMILCALEDALYECYEASKDEEEEEYEDRESFEVPENEESEMNYRNMRYGKRSAMRYAMRHNDDEQYTGKRYGHRYGMRRRDKMGRFM